MAIDGHTCGTMVVHTVWGANVTRVAVTSAIVAGPQNLPASDHADIEQVTRVGQVVDLRISSTENGEASTYHVHRQGVALHAQVMRRMCAQFDAPV